MTPPPDPDTAVAQATCCAAFVDELVAGGVAHAVIAPGSRSTPLALALAARPEVTVHVVHDERVAAFVALGIGLGGTPAALVCTSGTAAANFHPAVVEAGLSQVPMLVLTADRPPELRDVGAPQAIDQTHLYGRSVRWFHDPGVPDAHAAPVWRSLGARALAAAVDGPVHLNLPFREPLVGEPGPLPPRRRVAVTAPPAPPASSLLPPAVVDVLRRPRGLVLAGAGSPPAEVVAALVEASGWPLLADPVSRCRPLRGAIAAYDSLLRDETFASVPPDVVVRFGRPATSKVLAQWVAASGAPVVQVGGPGVIDPEHLVAAQVPVAATAALAEALAGVGDPEWRARWGEAAARAEAAIDGVLQAPLAEPTVARIVARHLPPGGELVVAASMPMRDLEWFGGPGVVAHANRGANGIDGVLSTALGVALRTGSPTVALLGDIAFVHDAGALTAITRRGVDLRVVVVDNDGGGIFSFLPQATQLPADRFEELFGTPHGTDVVALARAHGVDAVAVTSGDQLVARLRAPGPTVTVVRTDRAGNVRVHAALHEAVAAALRAG